MLLHLDYCLLHSILLHSCSLSILTVLVLQICFFDTVHLLKNVRNNLLNSKQFAFPAFNFSINDSQCSSQNGYITWRNVHEIYDQDCALKANLRKAPKLTYQSLHPGNKKQSFTFALSFDSTTIAACKIYFPDRGDVTAFLTLINH